MLKNAFSKEKISKLLKEEKFLLYNQLELYGERSRISKLNRMEGKLDILLPFGIGTYIALLVFSCKGLQDGVFVLLETIPKSVLSLGIPLASLGIGKFASEMYLNKFNYKKKLKEFSNAETQTQILEEEIRNEIEFEKIKNKNIVINKVLKKVETENSTKELAEESSNEDLNWTKNTLDTAFAELDVLSAKKVLYKRFNGVRNNSTTIMNIIISFIGGGFITLAISLIPCFLFLKLGVLSYSLVNTFSNIILPLVLGSVATGSYMIRRTMNYKKVFTKLNSELKNNSISLTEKDGEKSMFQCEAEIDQKISCISNIKLNYCQEISNAKSVEEDDVFEIDFTDERYVFMSTNDLREELYSRLVIENNENLTLTRKKNNKNTSH